MALQLIVVEDLADARGLEVGCPVVHVDDYLTGEHYLNLRHVQVINLCRSYRYLSVGYYCSLLAEARGHRVLPTVRTMTDLSAKAIYSLDAANLDAILQRCLGRSGGSGPGQTPEVQTLEVDIHFGRAADEALAVLARQLFELFPAPSLRVTFRRQGKWRLSQLRPLARRRLTDAGRRAFAEALNHYLSARWRSRRASRPARYDLAILHNPEDPQPPSDARALQRFVCAGRELGLDVELIERRDYGRLAEYDALFIRDTTRIDHYTYRFAKRAESEGMAVIDDPQSILRCTNKVYLAELLRARRIPTPRSAIVGVGELPAALQLLGLPLVLKVPDGSFSQGVFKAESAAEAEAIAERLLAKSELILAQEYLYTEFDWRVGILNGKPLYASQYFMSKAHWQIVHYDGAGGFSEGGFRTVAVEQAPAAVVSVALKAAALIGDGLYGVDVKLSGSRAVVIEVNDNPSIDSGVEDAVLKDGLYRAVMAEFVRRLDARRG